MVISEKLGFQSLDDYVSDMVRANVPTELEGTGNFERETHRRNRETNGINRYE